MIVFNDRIEFFNNGGLIDNFTTEQVVRETIKRDIKKLKYFKIIERIGSDKTGYWKVL